MSDPSGGPAALTPLDWDTRHFGVPVARLDDPGLSDGALAEALGAAGREGIRLVYWPAPRDRKVPEALLRDHHGLLADRKATYAADLPVAAPEGVPGGWRVRPFPRGPATTDLVALAVASGEMSRFRLDPNVPSGRFEALYEAWMARSTTGELADAVLVADLPGRDDRPSGVVTLSVRDGVGRIGLLAVRDDSRGRGLGGLLLTSAHREAAARGAGRVEVVTQLDNAAACRLYEKAGYRLGGVAYVYHFWPRCIGSGPP